jgi:ABC-type multidrug transport system fused ATPase/permease subunit
VFDHVQRMPVAFFTRTRTGALVSRLNNDVIGAQRAFSDTLSGVVANLVALALMLNLSWQITLLALVLLPVFVVPARRMGSRLARMEREAAEHNAVMTTQMTERFSAPGATLVKLYGQPERESAEFAARASRVRDIGVRTAMVQWVFVTALTVVSSLALALVYGLGGVMALRGSLEAGEVVALALLLTRLYAPLTALASARVEVMNALVSFGSPRTGTSSTTRSARTCCWPSRRPRTTSCGRCCAGPAWTTSWGRSPTVSTRSSASAATGCRGASGSA